MKIYNIYTIFKDGTVYFEKYPTSFWIELESLPSVTRVVYCIRDKYLMPYRDISQVLSIYVDFGSSQISVGFDSFSYHKNIKFHEKH